MRVSDRIDKRRLLIAFAASLFIHAIVVGAGPLRPIPVREERTASTRIVLERPRNPIPKPTPRPTPKPQPRLALATPLPVILRRNATAPRATAKPARRQGGDTAPRELAKLLATAAPPNGTTTSAASGIAAGGTGTGAGPGNGTGGASGSDTATGGGPCGFVQFVPAGSPAFANKRIYETISVFVVFADGHQETAKFPYPWIYDSDRTDPWSVQNIHDHPNMAVPLQTPPPGTDMEAASPIVKYVLAHSTPRGTTLLPLCPGQSENR